MESPLLLRPQDNESYLVVGECFLPALRDANGLLGPLPSPWTVKYINNQTIEGQYRCYFVNELTNETTLSDPRLGPLTDWKMEWDIANPDTSQSATFRNLITGELRYGDPRMSPDALRNLGFYVDTLRLL